MSVYNMTFDTPQTGSTRDVLVHGTMPAYYNGELTITLYVKNTTTQRAAGTGTFVRTIPLTNISKATTSNYHGTYNMAIVPKLHGTDAVTATWGLSDVNP
jgi:hypothetical protein